MHSLADAHQIPLILASTSPQRRILLERMGISFEVKPVDCPEDLDRDESAESMVERICRDKMDAALSQLPDMDVATRPIITSDTLVSFDHHRLGKPENREQAQSYLQLLSGHTHQVLTAVCLSIPNNTRSPEIKFGCSSSDVTFISFSEKDLEWYLDSEEWKGAAGAYRIQGKASCLIKHITGSPTGIMGLPLELLYGMLRACCFI